MDFRRGREKSGSRQMIEATSEMKDVAYRQHNSSGHLQSTVKPGDRVSVPPIRLGDTVVFFEGREAIGFDRMRPKTIWQCRHGAFHHDDIIGKPFGCRVFSRTTMGHVYALSPTPELWCQVVPSRTQIVQDFDQSIVIFRLDIKPGNVVVESGTGSGVMSTAIMRTIAPTGFLYTFEFNEIRAKTAQEEFNENELGSLSKVIHRDVCAERDQGGGFGHELDGKADAVFLDLPEPWLAVPHAKLVLKSGKKIASYSPCIEQVMKTCEALRSEGFHSVTTIECRLRPINYIDVQLDTPDFGAQQKQATTTPSAASSETSSGQLEDETCRGVENSDAPAAQGDSNGHHKAEVTAGQGVTVDQGVTTVTDSKKRARDQLVSGADRDTVECVIGRGRSERLPSKSAIRAAELAAARRAEPRTPRKLVCAQPFPVMRGHTAFLTFATTPVARRTLSTGTAAADRHRGSEDKMDKEESKGEEGGHAKAANSSTIEPRLVIHTKGQGDGGESKGEDEDKDRHETNPTGNEERHGSTDTSNTLGDIEPTPIPGP